MQPLAATPTPSRDPKALGNLLGRLNTTKGGATDVRTAHPPTHTDELIEGTARYQLSAPHKSLASTLVYALTLQQARHRSTQSWPHALDDDLYRNALLQAQ
jgi:hypothetical protein